MNMYMNTYMSVTHRSLFVTNKTMISFIDSFFIYQIEIYTTHYIKINIFKEGGKTLNLS